MNWKVPKKIFHAGWANRRSIRLTIAAYMAASSVPGNSSRSSEAANHLGLPMVLTGNRHFGHPSL